MATNGLTHIYCQMIIQQKSITLKISLYHVAMKTAIVVLNWNGRWLVGTISTRFSQVPRRSRTVGNYNASTDDSCAFLSHQYPQIGQAELTKIMVLPKGTTWGLNQLMQIFTATQ